MKKTNPFADLERRIGYRFTRKKLLLQALTHPSFANEQRPAMPDNQRLEFLGDAALGLAVAAHLFKAHPDEPEGGLTRLRSALASTEALHAVARGLDLGKHMRLGRGELMSGGMERMSNLADTLEAIIGAAFLDGGAAAVMKIVRRIFLPRLLAGARVARNSKGLLQEWLQSQGRPLPEYTIAAVEGPQHERRYRVAVCSGGEALGRGEGRSKREAEAAAAEEALVKMNL
jgi:ribonuclease-3